VGLARTTNPMATSIVRRIGDDGGALTRDVVSELDNLIAWAKLSPRCIHRSTASTNSSGAGPDTLHTFTLPANSLQANGDYLRIEYSGVFAVDDDDKGIRATFGGTEYANRGLGKTDFDGSVGWVLRSTIIRLSTTSVRVASVVTACVLIADSLNAFTGTSGNGGLMLASNLDITGLSDLTANTTTMTMQSLGVNANDVTQNLAIIELTQQ